MSYTRWLPTARAITASSTTFNDETKTPTTIEANTLLDRTKTSTPQKYGFKMSIWGYQHYCWRDTSTPRRYYPFPDATKRRRPISRSASHHGRLISHHCRFNSHIPGLASHSCKPKKDYKAWCSELFTPLKDLLQRRNIAVLLLLYTIYADTAFTLSSVTLQPYFVEVKPDTLEYSLYSIAFNIFSAVTTLRFYLGQI
jgi:hypothetical protein